MSCYYPNGDLSTDGDIPCSTNNGAGPCCPLNWQCESNGLCYLANEGYYGRYTCTDQTWQSSSCPQICTYDLTANGNEAILECTSGSYCCDTNRPELSGGTACCEAGAPRFSLAALPLLPPYNNGDSGASASSAAPSTMQPVAVPSTMQTMAASSIPPPPSSTPPSNTPTSTFLTSSTPVSSSTAHFTTPTSTPQTSSTSITPTRVTSSSSLSTEGSSSPSLSVVTQTVTPDGSQSAIFSSATSNFTGSPSILPPTKHSHIGIEVGIPIGVCFAALACCFWYWRRKRSRRSTPTPRTLQTDFIATEPKTSASSLFPRSPSTAPPDSYRSSTLVGTQPQHPQSAELQGSPTAGTWRNSRGSENTRSADTGATTSPRQSELPAMREAGVGNTNVPELPGTTSTYRPYRPPGWS